MKTLLLASAAAIVAAAGASAQDTGNFYLGGGYTYIDIDDVNFDALNLRAGYDFNRYFALEGEVLVGLGDESVDLGGGSTANVSLDYGLGAFGKVQYPFNEQFSVFARAGYAYVEAEASASGVTVSDDTDGFAYGAGAEFAFAGPNAIRVEYTRYEFEDDADADTFGASYIRRF